MTELGIVIGLVILFLVWRYRTMRRLNEMRKAWKEFSEAQYRDIQDAHNNPHRYEKDDGYARNCYGDRTGIVR